MVMPELESANTKEITLSWIAMQGSGVKYELFGDNDGDSTFNSIVVTDKTVFVVKKDLGDLSYSFKVRASNVCGFGPDSPVNKINLVLAPARVAKPDRAVKDCNLII
jgi:fibronectin type 3 domain-containing protein